MQNQAQPIFNNLYAPRPVSNFLIWSCVNFVLFGWAGWQVSALGLVFSLVVIDSLKENNLEKAQKYSKLALIFNILSSIKGFIMIIIKLYTIYTYMKKKDDDKY